MLKLRLAVTALITTAIFVMPTVSPAEAHCEIKVFEQISKRVLLYGEDYLDVREDYREIIEKRIADFNGEPYWDAFWTQWLEENPDWQV